MTVPSSATASVNVPPVSTPTRTRGTYLGGVPARPVSRRPRRRGGEGGDTDEPVSILDDEAHAWWAAPDDVPTAQSECIGVVDESDPYVVLGIPPTASWDEISGAHRRLAKE